MEEAICDSLLTVCLDWLYDGWDECVAWADDYLDACIADAEQDHVFCIEQCEGTPTRRRSWSTVKVLY